MVKVNPNKALFLCTFPPGADLEIEGLGRYFSSLFSAATEINNDFDFIIVTLPWHRKWVASVCENTVFKVETYMPKSIGGIALILWSILGNGVPIFKNTIRKRVLNKHVLVYNIHLVSAGILPHSLNTKHLYRILLPILTFIAKLLIFLNNKILKNNKLNYDAVLKVKDEELIVYKEKDFRRAIFDSAMKNTFSKLVKKYSKANNILLSMNNRYEIKKYTKSAMLVPDVIPLTQRSLFASDNLRWNSIIRDIEQACLNSRNWVTFSNSTEKAAQLGKVVAQNTQITVIPHASFPPGTANVEFQIIKSKGLEKQWVDYHWRAGQVKVTNQLFKFHTFNQNLIYIIYPTQYRPHKNIELLIESWQGVVEVHPEYKLVLTLDILKHSKLHAMIRDLGLSNSVIFTPGLSDSELIAWQARAQFVISTSIVEGAMPFMVSESAGVGVPFLLPALSVTKEILPQSVLNASNLDIDSSEALRKSLLAAIPQREAIREIQLDWAKDYSRTWHDVWNEWILVIERISKI